MRVSTRDKKCVWFETYLGKTEKTETVGTEQSAVTYRLGEYDITYGTPFNAYVYVSIPKGMALAASGNAKIEAYGAEASYRRYIVSEADLGLTIESLCWVDADHKTEKPDYRITRIGHSYNHAIYEIKEY